MAATLAYPVRAAAPVKGGHTRLLLILGGGVALFMVALGITAQLSVQPSVVTCPAPCRLPPVVGPALPAPHTYTSSALGYSLDYYDLPDRQVTFKGQNAGSVQFSYNTNGGGSFPITFSGEVAGGRTPRQLVDALAKAQFPSAGFVFAVPEAELGNNAGYAGIYDYQSTSATSQTEHLRVVIEAAVKNDVAVEVVAVGPYRPPNPATDGHPNPSLTGVTFYLDPIGNTVRWKGDQP
jgi:hypothetical protein